MQAGFDLPQRSALCFAKEKVSQRIKEELMTAASIASQANQSCFTERYSLDYRELDHTSTGTDVHGEVWRSCPSLDCALSQPEHAMNPPLP